MYARLSDSRYFQFTVSYYTMHEANSDLERFPREVTLSPSLPAFTCHLRTVLFTRNCCGSFATFAFCTPQIMPFHFPVRAVF